MTEPALIVSQSGRPTRGLPALVAARGHEPVSTSVGDRPEDGQYYLSPATVERIEQRVADRDRDPLTLVVDGTPHPGQITDLRTRLGSVTVVDKRRVLWERLAGENPVAATRVGLRAARIARRRAADSQREAATQGPSGTSGRLAHGEERIHDLRDTLEGRREAARRRVRTSHTAADARVVLLGRVDAPTTALWAGLTGETAASGAGRPARVVTATTAVGPHTVAVTDAPGVPGSGGLPGWLTGAVPGLPAALDEATCVLVLEEGDDSLREAVAERFDAPCRSIDAPDAATARGVLDGLLETATYAVRLPYGDDAHALVSELHDRATVHAIEYDDAMYARIEVARTASDELRRRVSAVGGEVKPLGGDE
jgi:50S ribosomal subunit-associated GTPase HflX